MLGAGSQDETSWLSSAPRACLKARAWDCGDGLAGNVLPVNHEDLRGDPQHPHFRPCL